MPNREQRRHPEKFTPPGHANVTAREGVCISWLTGGHPHPNFVSSLVETLFYDSVREGVITRHGTRISMVSSPRLADARCAVVRDFLKLPEHVRWHMWVDDDMSWNGDAIHKLLATAREMDSGITGGLTYVGGRGSGQMYPTMYVLAANPDKAVNFQVDRLSHYPKGGVVGVDATGAACILVRRDVYTDMRKHFGRLEDGRINPTPWFAEGMNGTASFGEDIAFCIRARQLGHKIMVDTRVPFGHNKTVELNEALYEQYLEQNGEKPLKSAGTEAAPEEVYDIAGPITEMTGPLEETHVG